MTSEEKFIFLLEECVKLRKVIQQQDQRMDILTESNKNLKEYLIRTDRLRIQNSRHIKELLEKNKPGKPYPLVSLAPKSKYSRSRNNIYFKS